jgi:hypothetical protein
MATVRYNCERLELYLQMFAGLVRGEHEHDPEVEDTYVNLLIDIRWPDVPKALAHVLFNEVERGSIRSLASTFESLVGRAALVAFGTTSHAEIPSWFFQNFECLLASTLHKLLGYFRNALGPPLSAVQRKRAELAFEALIDVAKGLRSFVGLGYLAESTGVHVLMSAVHNAKCDLLKEVVKAGPRCAALILADSLARHVLADPKRELVVQSSFCFFARSDRWRTFAAACHNQGLLHNPLTELLREVGEARQRAATAPPGILFLASEFLEADASPERALKVAARSTRRRCAQRASPIVKRSKPFLRLVKRLLSGGA